MYTVLPTSSQSTPTYDPWADLNDDGKINILDVVGVTGIYGASGDPIAKASLEYDSGWIDIAENRGQYFDIIHNLNTTDVMVDIAGKTTADGGVHQRYFGGSDFVAGWNKTYGGANDDGLYARCLVQTNDGGYAMSGWTSSFGAGGLDVWLVKTDADGNVQWNKTYGGTGDDTYTVSIVQTNDGGYAMASTTNSFGAGGRDFWLIKVDALGIMQWNHTYGGSNTDVAQALVQTSDGGYTIAGQTLSYGAGSGDLWLVRTDSAGIMQWSKTYGGASDDGATSMVQTSDGGYAMAGTTRSFGAGDQDFWLVRTDAAGNMQWSKTYGTAYGQSAYSLTQTFDGGYALAGSTHYGNSYAKDFWLVKADAAGNMQWNHAWGTAGGSGHEEAIWVVQDSDGGYSLVGYTTSYWALPYDMWLIKTDGNGNDIWNKTYGGIGHEQGDYLIRTSDGGYAIAGITLSYGAGGADCWLVKTDAAGNALDGFKYGLAWVDSTPNTIRLYRGTDDEYWNYVRICIWKPKTP
jgi:predicted secreted protein